MITQFGKTQERLFLPLTTTERQYTDLYIYSHGYRQKSVQ